MKFFLTLTLAVMTVVIMLIGCGQKVDNNKAADNSDFLGVTTTTEFNLSGQTLGVAGVSFVPPVEWGDLGASGMRGATYTFGPVEGDTDSATVAVFYFGAGGGGTIEANLDRWIMQMAQPDGGDPHAVSSMSEMTVDGMKAHLLKVPGIYTAGSGMMGGGTTLENYLMIGVVLEAPEGNLFFKLTGPEKTAYEMAGGLLQMVEAVNKN